MLIPERRAQTLATEFRSRSDYLACFFPSGREFRQSSGDRVLQVSPTESCAREADPPRSGSTGIRRPELGRKVESSGDLRELVLRGRKSRLECRSASSLRQLAVFLDVGGDTHALTCSSDGALQSGESSVELAQNAIGPESIRISERS